MIYLFRHLFNLIYRFTAMDYKIYVAIIFRYCPFQIFWYYPSSNICHYWKIETTYRQIFTFHVIETLMFYKIHSKISLFGVTDINAFFFIERKKKYYFARRKAANHGIKKCIACKILKSLPSFFRFYLDLPKCIIC